jgi:hypothetical protein
VKKVLAWFQAWFPVLRDITLLGIGSFGILHQEWTGRVNVALLGVYTAILGVPGAAAILGMFRSSTTTTTTVEQLPSSLEPPPQPEQLSH